MTTDEKIALAEKIANQLIGITASDWNRWVRFAESAGLASALRMAQILARSQSLRPGPKRSYEAIANTLPKFGELRQLSSQEIEEIFGYVTRCLVGRGAFINETARPSRH